MMKFLKSLPLLVLLTLSTTQLAAFDAYNQDLLSSSLNEMLDQPSEPFLVAEVTGTQQFIQFYSDQAGIVIDFPASYLNPEQLERAEQYFKKAGVIKQEQSGIDPQTDKEFTLIVWNKRYDSSQIDKIVAVSLGALTEIFQLPADSKITVIKGWE